MSISSANKLINDVHKKLYIWDERSQFKLKGVGNLSRSDMEDLILYAEAYIENGGNGFGYNLMKPLGSIKDVLDAYGIVDTNNSIW